jgi:hypothetical protein
LISRIVQASSSNVPNADALATIGGEEERGPGRRDLTALPGRLDDRDQLAPAQLQAQHLRRASPALNKRERI